MRLAVTGATGRMGRAVLAAAREREDCEVTVAVSRSAGAAADTGEDDVTGAAADTGHRTGGGVAADRADAGGVPLRPAADLPDLLEGREPDALVDFTAPRSSLGYVEAAARAGVPAVVGTTGFDGAGTARLRAAAEEVAVLHASNFAPGAVALLAAVREAVAALPGYDVEVTETHHGGKRDAPSGTAETILDEVEAVRPTSGRVHGREGDRPRREGTVGVHARRAGDVTGEHELLVAGNHEELRLTHRAGSRRVFAAGAIDAASWLAGRDAGWYRFAEVVEG